MAWRGIKSKMTLAIGGAVVATALALTAVTNFLVSLTSDLALKERSEETSKIVSQAIATETRQLTTRIDVLTQDSQFQQDYSFQAWDHLQESLTKLRENAHAQVAMVLNIKGDPVAESTAAGFSGKPLLASASLAEARAKHQSASTVETLEDQTLLLAASPIVYYNQTVGYALIGGAVDKAMLEQLKEFSGANLLLVRRGKPTAATCKLVSGDEQLLGLEARLAGATGIIPVDGLRSDEGSLLASALPLRAGGKLQGALLFALSAKEAQAIKTRVTRASLSLAILITLCASLVGLFVARRISDPIVEIQQSFREIAASGDLSRRITKRYPDEVGQMADSFNLMQGQIETLHERVVTAEQRMRSELQMASAVQEMLFPANLVDGPRAHFACHAQTSTETGGDWYTVIHSPTDHTTTVIIADVTGHGAPAALVTAIVHGFFRAVRADIAHAAGPNWAQLITEQLLNLNQTIVEATRRSLVMSLLVFCFDHRTLVAHYLNAGHLVPLIVRPQPGGRTQVAMLTMPPSSLVGDIEQPTFVSKEVQLAPDDSFLLYTDGLIECTNAAEEQYGTKRLRGLLMQHSHVDARSLRDLIHQDTAAFYGEVTPADDITFVVGRVVR